MNSWRTAFALALIATLCPSVCPAQGDTELRERSRIAWNKFLDRNCIVDMTEQAVRKVMDGRYRDIGYARANNEVYRLIFLLDDYHQVEFAFHNDSKLLIMPDVERRGQWLRLPDGNTVSIPDPAEVAAKAKVEAAAIKYIETTKGYAANTLLARLPRS